MVKLREIVLFLAFMMIFGIILACIPENFVEAGSVVGEDIEIKVAPPTENLSKVWRIEFNKELKKEDLDKGLIYVEDPLQNIHETELSLLEGNNKIVLVTPKVPYDNYKPYTLYVREGLKNAEDTKVISKTVKMDFSVEATGDVTIDTREYPNNNRELKNKVINGDLIIDGGGEVTLTNVKVTGNIIVNDVGENSLKLDNVKAMKLEVKDTNGARIFVSQAKRSEDTEESSILNAIDINEASSNPIKLEGDFSATKINVNQPVELKITKETSIAEVNMGTTEAKITSEDSNIDMAASIGSITGTVSEDLKNIQDQVEENKKKIEKLIEILNEIPKDINESYDLYLQRGHEAKALIKNILGDKVGQDYNNYPEYIQIRTANTLRSFMDNRKFTTLNQLETAFIDAKEWNKVFGEGMKYAAYHGQREANKEYKWPVISNDIEVGADITDIVMKLADGITTEQLNKDITVTILHEDEWNNGKYLNIDTENQRITLARLNKTNRQMSISIMFSIVDTVSGKESITNFIVTLEPQVSNIVEVNLTSDNKEIVPWIDNTDKWIDTFDTVTVGKLLETVKSSNLDDKLYIVDSNDNIVTDMSTIVNGYMQLQVKRGDDMAYYRIGARPVIDTQNLSIVKEVINNYRVIVYPGSTVRQVIDAVKTNYDDYKLIVIDKNRKEVNENTIVEEGMRLIVNGYGFEILIYIGEVNLVNNIKEIVPYINNQGGWVETRDNVTVGELLNAIESNNTGDNLRVVDRKNIEVDKADILNSSMRLEINRGDNKAYYRINAIPIIDTLDDTVIKEVINTWTLVVYPGKTVDEVINAVKKNHEYYNLFIIDKYENKVNGSSTLEEDMTLIIDAVYDRYRFDIVIYIGEINLTSNDESIVEHINNEDKRIYTYDSINVGDLLNVITSDDKNDILNVVDLNNIEVEKTIIVKNFMKLEINREGNKTYYSIGAIPILDTKNVDIIKEVSNIWTVFVFSDKTVREVLDAVETRYGNYQLSVRDSNKNVLDDNEIIEQDMELLVDTGNGRYGFKVSILESTNNIEVLH